MPKASAQSTLTHIELRHIDALVPDPKNARTHSAEQVQQLADSMMEFGFTNPLLVDDVIRAGNGRFAALQLLRAAGEWPKLPNGAPLPDGMVPVADCTGWTEAQRRAYALADNQLALNAGWDEDQLRADIAALEFEGYDTSLIGFAAAEIEEIMGRAGDESTQENPAKKMHGNLAAQFMIPPFSVFNAREGWWQDRKRAWLALGIKSEVGRGDNLIQRSLTDRLAMVIPKHISATMDFIRERRERGMTDEQIEAEAHELYGPGRSPKINTNAVAAGHKGKGKSYTEALLARNAASKHAKSFGSQDSLNKIMGQKTPAGLTFGEMRTQYSGVGGDLPLGKGGRAAIPGGGTGPKSAWRFKGDDGYKTSAERETASLKGGLTFGTSAHPYDGHQSEVAATGTSIFDPVLCEIAYRWYCPMGGTILDPFAGGFALGRHYVGVDLRAEQVEANRQQWEDISAKLHTRPVFAKVDDPEELTPVLLVDDVWIKRDDLFECNGAPGGKARTCLALAHQAVAKGQGGMCTASHRASPQSNIVARIAAHVGIAARCHMPEGEASPEMLSAIGFGAELVQHGAGYNNVIIARCREDAVAHNFAEIPFGMECDEAITQTRKQAANVPPEAQRLVMACGSGMSLAGVLHGLDDIGRGDMPVLAVQVGADPIKRLDRYAPANWRERVELVQSEFDYHDEGPVLEMAGVPLDPHYESKCVPYLKPGDLYWLVGIRQSSKAEEIAPAVPPQWHVGDSAAVVPGLEVEADMLMSCPPYGDLEVYSDDPDDISNMAADDFDRLYAEIIGAACTKLKDDRFAFWVVGEYRNKAGHYQNLVGKTVAAFEAAGLAYYGEAVLLTAIGSLPIRAAKAFKSGRKLGKTHQNILVFLKGNAKRAAEACGDVDLAAAIPEPEPDAADIIADEADAEE